MKQIKLKKTKFIIQNHTWDGNPFGILSIVIFDQYWVPGTTSLNEFVFNADRIPCFLNSHKNETECVGLMEKELKVFLTELKTDNTYNFIEKTPIKTSLFNWIISSRLFKYVLL